MPPALLDSARITGNPVVNRGAPTPLGEGVTSQHRDALNPLVVDMCRRSRRLRNANGGPPPSTWEEERLARAAVLLGLEATRK